MYMFMMSNHKKIIASCVPLSAIMLVLSLLVATLGGDQYASYSGWISIARLSGLLVFGFFSRFKFEITTANIFIQFGLLLIDIYHTLLAIRNLHYITFVTLVVSSLIQYYILHQNRELLKCEVDETKRLPRTLIRSFGTVNGAIIALIALYYVDTPWLFVLVFELQLYALYIGKYNEREDIWLVIAEVAAVSANVIAHVMTYSLDTYDIIEIGDFATHALDNITVYSIRSLTALNIFLDVFIVVTLTGLNVSLEFCSRQKKKNKDK